ncbi:LysR family transcriptional regulator [uncultured Dialister sp.]|jgi:DNA-binding transcriptional LysR family regulator|uniref:LysR family transcriptional regulator n=1 Tax=uncultured Dialister sp. TaxID=278064 RepID=UPI0025D722FE|nr:LysR family transcriptional regulator [uncultured Dialister sp.]
MKNIYFINKHMEKIYMDLRQLRYFKTIIEEGTITGAARKLHISQPPLSSQMHLLEKELGTSLFERGARQVTPTEAGSRLYRYALEMLDLEMAAREEISTLKTGHQGVLRLGLVSSGGHRKLYHLLKRYEDRYPHIQIKVVEGNSYELLEKLRKGKIDISLLRSPFSTYGLEMVVLDKSPMGVGFPKPWKEEVFLKDLGDRPLILYRRWEKIILGECEKEKFRPNVYCVADDARTCREWAEAGLGLALAPMSVLQESSRLSVGILKEDALFSTLCLARRKGNGESQSGRLLFRMAREMEGAADYPERM